MLLPLLWDDDNWQSRFHTLGMYNHALSVVIRRWQLTEHVSYLMNTSPCSDPCNETMTTDGAWFITLGMNSHAQTVVIRPWQLRELFHTWGIYYHALTVVMRRWQLKEHAAYLRSELPCSVRCHETMKTDGACFIPVEYITLFWPLSWDDGNWQSKIHTSGMNNHALTVVIRRWQLMEPVSCFKYISILWPLSWDGGNWRSMLYTWVNITNFCRCHEMMATDKE